MVVVTHLDGSRSCTLLTWMAAASLTAAEFPLGLLQMPPPGEVLVVLTPFPPFGVVLLFEAAADLSFSFSSWPSSSTSSSSASAASGASGEGRCCYYCCEPLNRLITALCSYLSASMSWRSLSSCFCTLASALYPEPAHLPAAASTG